MSVLPFITRLRDLKGPKEFKEKSIRKSPRVTKMNTRTYQTEYPMFHKNRYTTQPMYDRYVRLFGRETSPRSGMMEVIIKLTARDSMEVNAHIQRNLPKTMPWF